MPPWVAKEKSLACLRNAGSHSAVTYCSCENLNIAHILTLLTHPDLHIHYCQDLGVQSTPELVASQSKRVRRTPREDVLAEKGAQTHFPETQTVILSSVHAYGCVLTGAHARAAIGSPMACGLRANGNHLVIYNTKHAEAARLYYTTILLNYDTTTYTHTHTPTELQARTRS